MTPPPTPPLDQRRRRIESFLLLAGEELEAARRLGPALPRQTGYFIAQAAEKIARAALQHEGIDWGTRHAIGDMGRALPEDHPLRRRLVDLDHLSSASSANRYPTSSGQMPRPRTEAQLNQDFETVRVLLLDTTRELGMAHLLPRGRERGQER